MIIKNNKNNQGLRKYKKHFIFIPLIIALSIIIMAFEMKWKGYLKREDYWTAILINLYPVYLFMRMRSREKKGLTTERVDFALVVFTGIIFAMAIIKIIKTI